MEAMEAVEVMEVMEAMELAFVLAFITTIRFKEDVELKDGDAHDVDVDVDDKAAGVRMARRRRMTVFILQRQCS